MLRECAGTDGSETYEYAGHSAGNMRTMQRFLVGRLEGYDGGDDDDGAEEEEKKKKRKIDGGSESGGGRGGRKWVQSSINSSSRSSISSKLTAATAAMTFKTTTSRPLLLLLVLLLVVLAGGVLSTGSLYQNFVVTSSSVSSAPNDTIIDTIGVGQTHYTTTSAFLTGLLLASSLTCAGAAFVYSVFSKTLQHERDVFSYPAVIARRV